MTREMWMLDQLACSEMPMPLMVDGYESIDQEQQMVLALHADGVIAVVGTDGNRLPAWRVAEVCRLVPPEWSAQIAELRMRITDQGLKKYPGAG